MHTKNLFINKSSHRKHIKGSYKLFPHAYVEPSLTLLVKAINLGDVFALVISSQQKNTFRILDLVGKEETDALDAALSAIHIVAKE